MSLILHDEKAHGPPGTSYSPKKFFLPCGVCAVVLDATGRAIVSVGRPMADPIVDNRTHISPITRR